MEHWKLGCRWRTGRPLFYNYLKNKGFVVGVWDKEYEEGDLILLTDGFSGLGIAKVTGPATPAQDQPELEQEFKQLQIDYENYMLVAPARIFDLPRIGDLYYKARLGICRISDDMPTLIADITRYNTEFERMLYIDNVANLLKAKGQVILQGPPGTGKTWTAERLAEKLADKANVKLVQFHPAYAYEDFVRGIVAKANEQGGLVYEAENKTLADFAKQAAAAPSDQYFVLIIDEINRANLPSVLGELIYALEYRNKQLDSLYADPETGERRLVLPENLLIIGTMNTADRSVGHLDYAIRRRFAFISVLPEEEIIEDEAGRKLFREVAALFDKDFLAPEFDRKQVQPGHSYFMTKAGKGLTLAQKLDYEIRPLLEEYLRDGVLRPNAKDEVEKLRA